MLAESQNIFFYNYEKIVKSSQAQQFYIKEVKENILNIVHPAKSTDGNL